MDAPEKVKGELKVGPKKSQGWASGKLEEGWDKSIPHHQTILYYKMEHKWNPTDEDLAFIDNLVPHIPPNNTV